MKSVGQGIAIVASTAIFIGAAARASAERPDPLLSTFADDTGTVGTFNVASSIDTDNPCFQSLGLDSRGIHVRQKHSSCSVCKIAPTI